MISSSAPLKMALFKDRIDAGRVLMRRLLNYGPEVLVLALPRGGVPVAFEVAKALHAPLDVILVRKLGVPGRKELAMGAIVSGGVRVMNDEIVRSFRVPEREVVATVEYEARELSRRERLYRDQRPFPELVGRTVILVDDGLATGASMRAAVAALHRRDPGRLVVAVPVGARETCETIRNEVDEVVCAATPDPFYGVGQWYETFAQTSDEQVQELLARGRSRMLSQTSET